MSNEGSDGGGGFNNNIDRGRCEWTAGPCRAEGEKVGGVILHSPFVSVREAGISLLGNVAQIITDRWDNRIPLAELKCRLLIIHGASDEAGTHTSIHRLSNWSIPWSIPWSIGPLVHWSIHRSEARLSS